MKLTSDVKQRTTTQNKKTQDNKEQENNSSEVKEKVQTPCFVSSFDLFINVKKQREQRKFLPRDTNCSYYFKKLQTIEEYKKRKTTRKKDRTFLSTSH